MKRTNGMKRLGHMLWTLALAGTVLLTGCGSAEQKQPAAGTDSAQTAQKRIVKHELGETEITGDPKRVVALEYSFVDGLWELGVTPVGIAQEKDKDVEGLIGKKIEYTPVGTRQQPSLEVISSLQPDLIIGDLNRHKDIYKDLQKIAPTIILKSRNSTYQENLSSFATIGEALNKQKEAEQRLIKHKEIIAEFKKKIPAGDSRNVMLGVFRADSLSAHGSKSFDGELLEMIGIKNAIQDAPEPTVKISLEQMVQWDPDVIFLAEADDALLNEWKQNPLWNNITAVKNQEVHKVNRDLWTRYRGLKSAERIVEEAVNLLYSKDK
ncbi:ABC transporter substrate-binding protein [Brevibacillus sp. HB1.2]|uniref:ABC transporter substrate-binding protein n=1 Tax=Brevibacillus TaxID=55080 RepID=UPI00035F433E|nr:MULTISPECIES: Fe(3+) dicitrate ABC transporter substrate-binding protein [unclassified Brevibacillus]ATF16328.1 iron citrate ABC transporter substrate-binding protein [Brevibacillus brevis X23]NRS18711.1 ABC transporter substrate-binding protein [Brevibacillus sp. HB1.4B]NTU23952.1 ABC transporter substrate-binding protein [Brevibacillus sp. HB1.2]